ncbi:MAG TPA: 3-deoxy-manno-octulosonate cytidylyltransferase [Nitrospiraceae bacterium]|nr:3-deoxy-manno-octulosonate cytidylyltransferase [Nitrospiraceae bacterium]
MVVHHSASHSAPVTVVIPARVGSSRFPGKPLAMLIGKPLIQHVYERAQASPMIDQVLVATDDARIRDTVQGFGGTAVLMTEPFRTGTDRVAAVARQLPAQVFVNLQGDEIILHHELLADLLTPFLVSGAGMGTLKRRLTSTADVRNPGVVKVITDQQGEALYFSRAPIPHVRDGAIESVAWLHYVHLGIYIYTRETLLRLAELPTSPLEEAEKLEQLRALEHGVRIRVWETTHPSLRIDTPEDLKEAEAILQRPVPC